MQIYWLLPVFLQILDLCYFVIILFVFILGYGVASQAILYPNNPLRWELIRDVLHMSYWQMYGELFLEDIEGESVHHIAELQSSLESVGSNECTNDIAVWSAGTMARCPSNSWVASVLLGFYILITNVLMLNLLIAMFR